MKEKRLIQIQKEDNVAIAIDGLEQGETVSLNGNNFCALTPVPINHKIALRDFKKGDDIIKYGHPIGRATKDIQKGEWVHSHNMKTKLAGQLEYIYQPVPSKKEASDRSEETFMGYVRKNGEVGTRNEIWIIPTVSCVNHMTQILAEKAAEELKGCCDGIYAYPHNAGCSQLGDDHRTTQNILSSIIQHPNAGGVLIVSLGCENNNLEHFLPVLGQIDKSRVKFMIAQEEDNEIETGLRLLREIAQTVSGDKREPVSVSKLKIGFKCGGSDALSGVTANPLCGTVSDRITQAGGTAILTEVPEMFGAETILMNRADTPETFEKIKNLINSFKQYYMNYNQPIYENPSPGNKEGGITTLEEKSLGCIQKGGHAIVTDTLLYGQKARKPGLNLMNGPGNDSVSVTNLVASGAQIILFTTGRGNPLGTSIPSIKLASNERLYSRKTHWFDFNAGRLLEGASMEELSDKLWELILDVASGTKRTRNEIHGYKDIMIFKDGVLL